MPHPKRILILGSTALILLSVFGRPIGNALRSHGLLRATLLLSLCAALYGIYLKARAAGGVPSLRLGVGVIIAILFSIWGISLPEERFHLIEYASLTLLAAWAFGHRGSGLLYSVIFGLGEELLQIWIPGRYFEFRDVALNWAGSLLGFWIGSSIKANKDDKAENPAFSSKPP